MSTKLSEKSVGDVIKLSVGGTLTNFIIINQGIPGDDYDSSCDGTWVVSEDVYTTMAFSSSSQLYADSPIHTYLNDTFYGLLDSDTQGAVLTVKIPYSSASTTVQTGSNGLSVNVFLLSATEVDLTSADGADYNYMNTEGTALPYFTSDTSRIAYYNGSAYYWWTRSPSTNSTSSKLVWRVNNTGLGNDYDYRNTLGVRPALVLDSSVYVTDDGELDFNATPPTISFTVINDKAIGDTVKINVGGTLTDFIVIQQGLPSSDYDSSCDGTWVMMKNAYTQMAFGESQLYADSDIHSYLNSTFYNLLDDSTKAVVRTVKIPYSSAQGTVQTGANGLETNVFIPSGTEVGFSNSTYLKPEGAALSYSNWNDLSTTVINSAYVIWWTRSPMLTSARVNYVINVGTSTNISSVTYTNYKVWVRPVMILNSDTPVTQDGLLITNADDLGTINDPFDFSYTVSSDNTNTLEVTEALDSTVVSNKSDIASGTAISFANLSDSTEFQKLLNGTHTITISVTDGTYTTVYTTVFTKHVTTTEITLATPVSVDNAITSARLRVSGNIPDDAAFAVMITNNANDDSPVWQDVTTEVIAGELITFENTTADNGAAFNFIVTVSRGDSDTGGYISSIMIAFE